jgi:hypothetical protein
MELLVASMLLGWFAVATIVVGLCVAAARGDKDGLAIASGDLSRFTPAGADTAYGAVPAGERAPAP